jgi:hypothetical protein
MTEITREIILDLLPVYFSGEASEETQRLVEEYFEGDPEFAQLARRMNEKLLQAVPIHLPENHQMATLRRTQDTLKWRVIGLAVLVSFAVIFTLIVMAFLMVR